jgi:KaiC domain protein
MSGDWFEEAISDLDEEELDDEQIESLQAEGEIEDLDIDSETDDAADDTEPAESDVDAAKEPAESADESAAAEATDEESEADVFGFSTDEPDTAEDAPEAARESTDEFGFDGEPRAESNRDEKTAAVGDSSTAQSADEFGFGADDTESSTDEVDGSDDDTADQSEPTEPTDDPDETDNGGANSSADEFDADSPTQPSAAPAETDTDTDDADVDRPESKPASPETVDASGPAGSSTAQSPEEFGFSIGDDEADPTPDTDEASTPEPESEPSDDPFGFGNSGSGGSSGGGGGMAGSDDDEFGFGGFSGGGGGGGGGAPSPSTPEDFDDEDFESDIDRIDLGIKGLDEMILGGVPERSLIGIIGGAGTGKTTFALQFLNEALENGERAVFITLEQTEEAVLSTAEEKGWSFREYADDNQLAVVVLDPVEMANSLATIRSDISRLIREFGASRLVLDSVSLLEMMYDHPAKRRSEVFDFTRSLKDAGVTTLLTSEASEDSSHASRYGAVEYLTDAVFVLRYVRTSNFEETRLAIEIQKIRDANHSRATKPYDLTDEGMSVHRQANIF